MTKRQLDMPVWAFLVAYILVTFTAFTVSGLLVYALFPTS